MLIRSRDLLYCASLGIIIGAVGAQLSNDLSWIKFFDNMHWTSGSLGAAILALVSYRNNECQEKRGAKFWFALGFSNYAIGQIIWDIQTFVSFNQFPSPSDFFYLCLGPCLVLGLIAEIKSLKHQKARKIIILDTLALSTASLTFVLVLYLPQRGSFDLLTLLILIAYPISLLMVSITALMMIPSLRLTPSPALIWFLTSSLATAYSWMRWNLLALKEINLDGDPLNPLFSIAILISGFVTSVWHLEKSRQSIWEHKCDAVIRLLPFINFLLASGTVITVTSDDQKLVFEQELIIIGGLVVIVMAMLRQAALIKEHEQMLRTQSLLRTVIDTVPQRIFWKDTQGRYLGCNSVFAKDAGKESPLDLIGKNDYQMSWAEEANRYVVDDQAVINSGIPKFNLEEPQTTPSGKQVWLRTSKVPLVDHNKNIIGILGIYEDITKQKKTEAEILNYREGLEHLVHKRTDELNLAKESAEIANSAKSAFLANMSHEIRTPLNAVLGFCYLLEQKRVDSDSRELIQKIHNAGRTLLSIINDILDFSKIEAGRIELENTTFHLHSLLENVASVMHSLAGAKDLELIIAPPTNIASLIGDEFRLQQVLINLVSNALKFTEHGEVSLAVTCSAEIENALWLRFSVKDTGIGMSEEQQAKLFEAFSQADMSISRRFGGTGLGLVISQRLVELMGGKLQVSSTLGVGSEFWFELPLQRTSDVAALNADEPLNHLQLLIADDNDGAREALKQTVRSLGWKADLVNSGETMISQTLQRLGEQQSYDVLLIDWMMPELDGLTTAQQLRGLLEHSRQASPRTPIVLIVTAYSKDQLANQPGLEAIDGILTKPVTPSALYESIARISNKRSEDVFMSTTAKEHHLAGIRLLVVDDSDINREIAKRILEDQGAVVSLANDGQYAVDWLIAHETEVDLVLMDIQMPRLDGYQATRKIRDYPQFEKLPILALTAGAFSSLREAAFEAGMNDFIAKPFNVDLMLERIKHWTKPHSKHQLSSNAKAINPQTLASKEVAYEVIETDFPNFPGIDMAQGIKIWGSVKDFQTYLLRFEQQYKTAGLEMLALLEQGNTEAIAKLAHKLKGAAFSVALQNIPEYCSQIEATLYDIEQLTKQVNALQAALDDISLSIDLWFPKPMLSTPTEDDKQRIRNQWPTLEPILKKLMVALDEDNLASAEAITRHLENLMHQYYLLPINDALTEFNLREAEIHVRSLMSTFTP